MFGKPKKRPCIRNIPMFKDGCPQNDSCPCWKSLIVAKRSNPLEREQRAQCMDEWIWEFTWAHLGSLDGVQAATESFRNVVARPDGPLARIADVLDRVRTFPSALPENELMKKAIDIDEN